MELLILDTLLRPVDVVDVYISLIWTERFSETGDFELVTLSSAANQKRFSVNTWLAHKDSRRIMQVLTVDDSYDDDGNARLTIKGREITHILEMRLALQAIAGPGIAPVWFITGKSPGDVMRYIFNQICVLGTVSSDDIIPFIDPGTLYPASTIPEPTAQIEWEQKPATVLAAEKELSRIYDLGYRLYRDPSVSKLYFDVYAGSDRTSAQTTLPAVIFSPDMENLQNTREFRDVSQAVNVVRVLHTYTDEITETDMTLTVEVRDDELVPPEGFDRKVKLLEVSTIPEDVTDVAAFLYQSGFDELMKSRPLTAFDGEITPTTQFVYERDYYLGDLVEIRSASGATAYMRVEEYIFVNDAQGYRSYPTLTTKRFIDPGSWLSWKYDIPWEDMEDTEFWANQ
jgi:hypothetical protein